MHQISPFYFGVPPFLLNLEVQKLKSSGRGGGDSDLGFVMFCEVRTDNRWRHSATSYLTQGPLH